MGPEARALSAFVCGAALLACRAVEEPVLPEAWPAERAEQPLSHADCVELALSSVPNAAAWRARLDAARVELARAGTLPDPLFTLGWEDLSIGRDLDRPRITILALGTALSDVLMRKGRTVAASHDLAAEEASLLAERRRLTAEVEAAYDGLLAARARAELEDERVRIVREERDALQRFVEAGFAAHIDVERSEADLTEAEIGREQADSEARANELALAFALGFERPVALTLSEPMVAGSELELCETTELLTLAAAGRTEITAARERYAAELERLNLTASALRFLPNVEVGIHTEEGAAGGTASLDVPLPLFDGGTGARSAAEATLLLHAAELRRVARDIGREVTLAAERLRSARVALEQHVRPQAERRLHISQETRTLFTAGERDYAEVLGSRRDELTARVDELEAREAVALACIDLEAAVGSGEKPAE